VYLLIGRKRQLFAKFKHKSVLAAPDHFGLVNGLVEKHLKLTVNVLERWIYILDGVYFDYKVDALVEQINFGVFYCGGVFFREQFAFRVARQNFQTQQAHFFRLEVDYFGVDFLRHHEANRLGKDHGRANLRGRVGRVIERIIVLEFKTNKNFE
jgi:hypothetical protein